MSVVYGDGADTVLDDLFDRKVDLVVMAIPAGRGVGADASLVHAPSVDCVLLTRRAERLPRSLS